MVSGCFYGSLGKNKHFNIEHLVKIADVLEVDVCEFFKKWKKEWKYLQKKVKYDKFEL